ncbi:MAG: hypothetical protein KCHDKBKB_00390 [Elusimicrobia bacterium]|nr:hypothetical protein [Elusimicrobiota bacterium]
MKKLVFSVALVALGAGCWWLTARTARFSIKKWDAKFGSVLRAGLSQIGVSDGDLLSSIHEIRKDPKGEWVVHRLSVARVSPDKQKILMKELEESGAEVKEEMRESVPTWVVKRGSRVYQEIQFAQP